MLNYIGELNTQLYSANSPEFPEKPYLSHLPTTYTHHRWHQFISDIHWCQNRVNKGEIGTPKGEGPYLQRDEIYVCNPCVGGWSIEESSDSDKRLLKVEARDVLWDLIPYVG